MPAERRNNRKKKAFSKLCKSWNLCLKMTSTTIDRIFFFSQPSQSWCHTKPLWCSERCGQKSLSGDSGDHRIPAPVMLNYNLNQTRSRQGQAQEFVIWTFCLGTSCCGWVAHKILVTSPNPGPLALTFLIWGWAGLGTWDLDLSNEIKSSHQFIVRRDQYTRNRDLASIGQKIMEGENPEDSIGMEDALFIISLGLGLGKSQYRCVSKAARLHDDCIKIAWHITSSALTKRDQLIQGVPKKCLLLFDRP